MNTEERERALLKLVQDERDKACRRVLAEAAERARGIKRDAYQRERGLLHQRVEAERRRAEGLLRAATAERATAARRQGDLADARLIAAAWPRLRVHLSERWARAESRAQWVHAALLEARTRLPHIGWTIRYAPQWPEAERAQALAALAQEGIPEPTLREDGQLSAGLVIATDGGMLDMSLEGLLQDREQVEARLLALAKAARPAPSAPHPVVAAGGALEARDA